MSNTQSEFIPKVPELEPNFQKHTTTLDVKLNRSYKTFKVTGIISLCFFGIALLCGVVGLTSPAADLVNAASNIILIIGIPFSIIVGIWFSQLFRISFNIYDKGKNLNDSLETGRNEAHKILIATRYIASLLLLLSLILISLSALPNLVNTTAYTSSFNIYSDIRGNISLILFALAIAFITLSIITTVKLHKNRPIIGTTNTSTIKRTTWVFRWFLFLIGASTVSIPTFVIMAILYMQLYSRWCDLTNSKCY